MKKQFVIFLGILLVLLTGCAAVVPASSEEPENAPELSGGREEVPSPESETQAQPEEEPEPEPVSEPTLSSAELALSGMRLVDKLWQLVFVRPEAVSVNGETVLEAEQIENASLKHFPGGIVLFSKNISDPEQLLSLTSGLHLLGDVPMMLAVDEEGGAVARIASNEAFDVPRYENMESIGLTGDPAKAKEAGFSIGTYGKAYGFDLDFAPVADVNTNPDNIVIGSRSFGNDPKLVGAMVSSFIGGMHEAGMLTCLKHFPGHGDTTNDTHSGAVTLNKTWVELTDCELLPFWYAIGETDSVMAAHICLPEIDPEGLPASLSHTLLTEKLRGELEYGGLVITDALEMGAITQNFTSGEAAVKAIQAGADILLMPENANEAVLGLLQAVYSGEISEERIDESVLRILQAKEKAGLLG